MTYFTTGRAAEIEDSLMHLIAGEKYPKFIISLIFYVE